MTTIWVDGTVAFARGRKVADRLREAGLKPLYSARCRAFMIDARRLPDALAALQSRNVAVRVVDDEVGGDSR